MNDAKSLKQHTLASDNRYHAAHFIEARGGNLTVGYEGSMRALEDDMMRDDFDPGGFSGYANVKGYLDSYGTIMADGCYMQSIANLLRTGFVPDTHGVGAGFFGSPTPTLKNTLGFFKDAKEDEYGLWVDAVFYKTRAAQEARMQCKQRLDANCCMGISIGFEILQYEVIKPEQYETELPKYIRAEYLEECMQRAYEWTDIWIIKKMNVFEASLTVIPANEMSQVLEVRSAASGGALATSTKFRRTNSMPTQTKKELQQQIEELRIQIEQLSEQRAGAKLSKSSKETLEAIYSDVDASSASLRSVADRLRSFLDESSKTEENEETTSETQTNADVTMTTETRTQQDPEDDDVDEDDDSQGIMSNDNGGEAALSRAIELINERASRAATTPVATTDSDNKQDGEDALARAEKLFAK